jgi:hypothetical protein
MARLLVGSGYVGIGKREREEETIERPTKRQEVEVSSSSKTETPVRRKPGEPDPDIILLQKIRNMVKWLQTLGPIRAQPRVIIEMNEFACMDRLGFFKNWFKESVRPNLGDLLDVTTTLMLGWELFPADFKEADLQKFGKYLMCLNDFVIE